MQTYAKCLNALKCVKLYFSGYASGQHYNAYSNRFGGPANLLCLPHDPELSNMTAQYSGSFLYGTEYEEFFSNDSWTKVLLSGLAGRI